MRKSQDPQWIFKNSNKDTITDFQFSSDSKTAFYISRDNTFFVHSFKGAYEVIDERRSNVLACDIIDGYAFGKTSDLISSTSTDFDPDPAANDSSKGNNKVHYISVSKMKSCYEELHECMTFDSLEGELLYFVSKYSIDSDDFLKSLLYNLSIALEAGKVEIAGVWKALHDLLALYEYPTDISNSSNTLSPEKNNLKISYTKEERFREILLFYEKNPDRFEYDLQTKKIKMKEDELCITSEYEPVLADMIKEFNDKMSFVNRSVVISSEKLNKIAEDLLQDLIDNGEFIHAYKMYSVLRKKITLSSETIKLWEYTYIDVLKSMSFYNKSAETIKYSPVQEIRSMSLEDTRVIDVCGKCKSIGEKGNMGYCDKCKDYSTFCSVCRLPVKRLYMWCQVCGHGGHLNEITKWFLTAGNTCPAGCGHKCFKFN